MDNSDKKKGINASISAKLGKDAPKPGGWFGKPKPAATKAAATKKVPMRN